MSKAYKELEAVVSGVGIPCCACGVLYRRVSPAIQNICLCDECGHIFMRDCNASRELTAAEKEWMQKENARRNDYGRQRQLKIVGKLIG